MNSRHAKGCIWLAPILLVLAGGCGGSDESAPEQVDSNTDSPQAADQLPKPGELPQPPPEADPFPRVEFQTTAGNFTVKLHRGLVPKTVKNFLDYVGKGFYVGTVFHEVTPAYAVLGGNYIETPDGQLELKPADGVSILNEAAKGLSNTRGTIAMAREPEVADSARCQFFINLDDNTGLDYQPEKEGVAPWQTAGYCAFGEVESGIEVLDEIASQPVTSRNGMSRVPVKPVTITGVRKL